MEAAKQACSVSAPVGMTSGAISGTGLNMTLSTGTSMTQFPTLPLLPNAPQPTIQLFWEQPRLLTTAGMFPGNPLILSPLPGMSVVPGAGRAGGEAVPLNITQVNRIGGPAQPLENANFILNQGVLCGGVQHSSAQHFTAPAVSRVSTPPAALNTQSNLGTWVQGLPPSGPPPVMQMVPIVSPVEMPSRPQGAYRKDCLTKSQSNTPQKISEKPRSVYENFRLWQKIKALVHKHLPQTPDVEAFSCFLIPVLRSLARRRPSMTTDEGLWRGLKEWKCTNTSEQMNYHVMANKFMEFEQEENQAMNWLENQSGSQCQYLPAPPRLDPPRPPATQVIQQPVCTSVKSGPENHPAHPPAPKRKRPPEAKSPNQILPKVTHEDVHTFDWLEGCLPTSSGENDEKRENEKYEEQQEDEVMDPDQGFLSYLDELCSQQDFVNKVEAVISPEFLSKILSSAPEIDIVALNKELEEEERLTLDQLVEKRLQSSKKKRRVEAPWKPRKAQEATQISVLTAQ